MQCAELNIHILYIYIYTPINMGTRKCMYLKTYTPLWRLERISKCVCTVLCSRFASCALCQVLHNRYKTTCSNQENEFPHRPTNSSYKNQWKLQVLRHHPPTQEQQEHQLALEAHEMHQARLEGAREHVSDETSPSWPTPCWPSWCQSGSRWSS